MLSSSTTPPLASGKMRVDTAAGGHDPAAHLATAGPLSLCDDAGSDGGGGGARLHYELIGRECARRRTGRDGVGSGETRPRAPFQRSSHLQMMPAYLADHVPRMDTTTKRLLRKWTPKNPFHLPILHPPRSPPTSNGAESLGRLDPRRARAPAKPCTAPRRREWGNWFVGDGPRGRARV